MYQQERYEEARIYIEQALNSAGWNAAGDTLAADSVAGTAVADTVLAVPGDILEHAGDIYFRLNDREKALEMWQKALESGVDDEATLRKKIKRKKL